MLLLRSSPRSPPCPTLLLRPPTPTSPPPLPPTSLPPLSRPTTLPSPSSRTSPHMEPSTSLDQSAPTRLSTSQLSTRPAPTQSRLFPRLLPPLSTLCPMSQLLLMLLPPLLLLLMLLPQWLMLLTLLPPLLMLLPLLPTLLMLLPQLSLLKQRPKCSSVPKSESERELYNVLCAVSDFLRHTRLYNRKVGVSWWLFLVFLRTTSNVSVLLQYDVTTSITSGLFLLLNVSYMLDTVGSYLLINLCYFCSIFSNK